jgi:ABC-type multidrug transport system fused ATPase/permease subunit
VKPPTTQPGEGFLGQGAPGFGLSPYLRWILAAWRPQLRWVPVLLFLTLLSAGVTLAYPLVFGHVLDEVRGLELMRQVSGAEVDAATLQLVKLLLAIGAARMIAGYYPAFRALVNVAIEVVTRERLFAAILRKGYRTFATFRTGDLITRLTDDITGYPKIGWFVCSGLFRAVDSGARVVTCLAVMLWLDWRLALWALLPVPLMIGVYLLLKHHLERAVRDQRAAASETSDHLEAAFTGAQVVQAYDAQDRLADTLSRQLGLRAEAEVRLARLWVMFSIFFQSLNVVGQLLVVVLGGLRVLDGSLALGDFFAFYLFLGLLLAPMMDLPNLLVTSRQAFVCMDRVEEVARHDVGQEGGVFRGQARVEELHRLAAEGVSFGFLGLDGRPGPDVLHGVDLALERGARVALVGEVGAGKTTLVRVLAGAVPPGQGQVTVNDRPLPEHAAQGYRPRVGFVPQDPVLFAGTVADNVVFGREPNPERVARALDLAGLGDEVAALPDGVESPLGLRGQGLSGGQRQRLAIARALYDSPPVLLLDDITAALDAENEERFWTRLLAEQPDVTALVVTHRPATAQRCDRVAVLEAGQVTARGTHAELLRSSPAYQRFCTRGEG